MAAESSTAASGSRSGGGVTAESYIGSLISLTSKSEIRYEGILYNINTEESSIGLRNVRSFGTEGRRKDDPQVPPSDKVYEYILFRGSDIKDLQVKASPPVQTTPPINNDPAIIQSHYPRPVIPPSTSLPTVASGSLMDPGSQSAQLGHSVSTFQNGPPLYQSGGNLNSWGPSPNANGSGLAMPMYWQGFYGSPNGLPQLPQQSLLRPPPGLSMPTPMQQMQYSGLNTSLTTGTSSSATPNLPDYQSPLVPNNIGSGSLTSMSFPPSTFSLGVPPLQPMSMPSETISDPMTNKTPLPALPTSAPSSTLQSLAPFSISLPDHTGVASVANKPSVISGLPSLPNQAISQPLPSVSGISSSVLAEAPTHSLVTPGQLLQSGPPLVSSLQSSQKDVEVVQVSSEPSPEKSLPVATEAQPPILPLPPNTQAHKPNGAGYHMRNHYRGRGGRGAGISRPVTKFTEDFDFMAMNEKFNKDEVWGHLGKSNKSQYKERNDNDSDEDDFQDEDDPEMPKVDVKPVYNKDDFFDSLSCNALDNGADNGRIRYSEQRKLDTETFGDFSRYRGGRGGRGYRGGGRFRGSYQGRGYGGYGYAGRGRGRGVPNRAT